MRVRIGTLLALGLLCVGGALATWVFLRTSRNATSEVKQASASLHVERIDTKAAGRVYAEAKLRGDPTPGATAFRSYSDDFVNLNPDAVKEQMKEEGLTFDEVKELTYFGLLATRTMAWDDVEKILKRNVKELDRKLAGSVL